MAVIEDVERIVKVSVLAIRERTIGSNDIMIGVKEFG